MAVVDLLPALRDLSRGDKLRVVQFLVQEMAREEDALLEAGGSYPVWTPYDAHEAAETLLGVLGSAGGRARGER